MQLKTKKLEKLKLNNLQPSRPTSLPNFTDNGHKFKF